MSFEVYHPRSKKTKEIKNVVGLSKNSIVLNKPARALLQIEDQNFLQLAYDKKQKIIRLEKVGADQGGVQIRKSRIFSRGFFNSFGITTIGKFSDEQVKYEPDENALYVTLKKAK